MEDHVCQVLLLKSSVLRVETAALISQYAPFGQILSTGMSLDHVLSMHFTGFVPFMRLGHLQSCDSRLGTDRQVEHKPGSTSTIQYNDCNSTTVQNLFQILMLTLHSTTSLPV